MVLGGWFPRRWSIVGAEAGKRAVNHAVALRNGGGSQHRPPFFCGGSVGGVGAQSRLVLKSRRPVEHNPDSYDLPARYATFCMVPGCDLHQQISFRVAACQSVCVAKQRRCKTCRAPFTPAHGTSRVNCYGCRPPRGAPGGGPAAVVVPVPEVERPAGPMELAARAELTARGRLDSFLGQGAVLLARTLDDPGLSQSTKASLMAQAQRTMALALEGAPRPPDRVDELAARAAAKRETA